MRSILPRAPGRRARLLAAAVAIVLACAPRAQAQAPDARELTELERRLQQLSPQERARLLQLMTTSRGVAAADSSAKDSLSAIDDRLPARPIGGAALPQPGAPTPGSTSVRAPVIRSACMPRAPSTPIPVSRTATACAPACSAAERNSTSTAGRQWCTGGDCVSRAR